MQPKKYLIAGNWKMHGSVSMAKNFHAYIDSNWVESDDVELLICPPYPYISVMRYGPFTLGGQDCAIQSGQGAFTGDISADMLADVDCSYVILGHSERRAHHNESGALIHQKMQAAHAANINVILCVGESESERESGKHTDIVVRQLEEAMGECCTPTNMVIAYEPVWAIGTGKTARAEDAQDMHAFIKNQIGSKYKVIYGGSVKPDNARELMACKDIDGALIGGASLDPKDFLAIARQCR